MKFLLIVLATMAITHGAIGIDDNYDEATAEKIKKFIMSEQTPDTDGDIVGQTRSTLAHDEEDDMDEKMMKRWWGSKPKPRRAEVWLNGHAVPLTSLPYRGAMQQIYRHRGGLAYIINSRTHDNIRIDGNGPFDVNFSDRRNNYWHVRIYKNGPDVTFMIPCGTEIYFNPGHVRTGSDAQTAWAELNFSYLPGGSWGQTNGVRIRFHGYRYGDSKEWNGDKQLVEDIFTNVEKGVKIAKSVAEIIQSFKGRGRGRG